MHDPLCMMRFEYGTGFYDHNHRILWSNWLGSARVTAYLTQTMHTCASIIQSYKHLSASYYKMIMIKCSSGKKIFLGSKGNFPLTIIEGTLQNPSKVKM